MNPTNGNDDRARLTELEKLTESLVHANRHMLTAQIILNDRQGTLEQSMKELVESQKRTDESQKRTDAQIAALTAGQKDANERVDKLVIAIGRLIERLPPAWAQGSEQNVGS